MDNQPDTSLQLPPIGIDPFIDCKNPRLQEHAAWAIPNHSISSWLTSSKESSRTGVTHANYNWGVSHTYWSYSLYLLGGLALSRGTDSSGHLQGASRAHPKTQAARSAAAKGFQEQEVLRYSHPWETVHVQQIQLTSDWPQTKRFWFDKCKYFC